MHSYLYRKSEQMIYFVGITKLIWDETEKKKR